MNVFRLIILSFVFQVVYAQDWPSSNVSTQHLFYKANEAYLQGHYNDSEKDYLNLLSQVPPIGAIYYNLANTYYRLGKIGKAIFYYKKAQILLPRDPEVQFNLEFVRSKLARDEAQLGVSDSSLSAAWLKLNLKESYVLFLWSSVLCCLISITLLFFRKSIFIWIRLAAGILGLCALMLVLHDEYFCHPFGVVIAKEAKIFSGTGVDQVLLFELGEGAEFNIVDQTDPKWARIQLADGRQGYINRETIILN